MRSSFVCVLTLLICNLSIDLAKRPEALHEQPLDEHAALLAPIEVDALTLFPIVAIDPASDEADVLSLDEAMQTRLLRIREVDGGQVDSLQFANAADQPVFLLAGEVILGGKQDRVIATNTIVPPHTTQVVPVRCVEAGRWDGQTTEFTTAERLANDRLRGTATYAAQSDVWIEVKRLNRTNEISNPTDTYRDLANRQVADVARLEHKIDNALADLPRADRRRMIGYAIAYAGEVAAIDMFQSTALFAKLERKLLRSYIAEAGEHTMKGVIKSPCVHAVRDFIANAKRGAADGTFKTDVSSTSIQRGTVSSTSQVAFGERHLYANYLGNARVQRSEPYLGHPPGGSGRVWVCDRHLYPGTIGAERPECWSTYDRHLYPSYLGNYPGGQGRTFPPAANGRLRRTHEEQAPPCDRRLYPSYTGNNPGPACVTPNDTAPVTNGRLRRTDDEPGMNCERSLYPSYIGNTQAWNECRAAQGLPTSRTR